MKSNKFPEPLRLFYIRRREELREISNHGLSRVTRFTWTYSPPIPNRRRPSTLWSTQKQLYVAGFPVKWRQWWCRWRWAAYNQKLCGLVSRRSCTQELSFWHRRGTSYTSTLDLLSRRSYRSCIYGECHVSQQRNSSLSSKTWWKTRRVSKASFESLGHFPQDSSAYLLPFRR